MSNLVTAMASTGAGSVAAVFLAAIFEVEANATVALVCLGVCVGMAVARAFEDPPSFKS